ncbi:hypothetical protein M9434_000819 [Picochlorum sp. BPE23]|nr:hypothetical protein M9434_000819 [Picochlorum sp. BPE23]
MLVRPCTPRDIGSIAGAVERAKHSDKPTMRNRAALLQQHPKRVLVKWRDDALPVMSLDTRGDDGGLERDRAAVRFPYSRLDVPADGNTERLLHSLKSDMRIEYAEPDYMAFSLGQSTSYPDDPYYDNLWHLHAVNAQTAWRVSQGSKEVRVCVVDSGIDSDHEDLNGNIDNPGFDAMQDQATLHDSNGHGTACTGILGAMSNNTKGITGIMWHTNILGCRFLDADGHGYLSDAIKCMQWCVENGAHIINHSWGTYSYSKSLRDSMEYLSEQYGVLFVAAAGNEALDNDGDTPMYPAALNLSSMITVAATDETDSLASFSNFGKYSVDIAAPGVDILSTIPHNSYSWFSGTSMAAPLVSGTAGLIRSLTSQNPSPQVLKQLVLDSSSSLSSLHGKIANGRFLNVSRAVEQAQQYFWRPGMTNNSTLQSMFAHSRSLDIRKIPFKSKWYNILDNESLHFSVGPEIDAFCPESRYPRYNFKNYLTDTLIPKHWFLLEHGNIERGILTLDTCIQPHEDPWDSLLIVLDCDAQFKSCSCRADNDGCGKRQRGSKIRFKARANRYYAAIVMPGDPIGGGQYKIRVR